MRWAKLVLAVGLLLSCFLGSLAVTSRVAAQSDAASDADARRFFEEGRAAYEGGDFEGAIRGFRRAYVLSPRYALLYNIGQAELRAGHDPQALEALEGFLRQAPAEDSRRSEVEERVRVLRSLGVRPASETVQPTQAQTTTEATAVTTQATEPSPPPSSGDTGPGFIPWIVVGGGGALLITGAVLMGVASGDASRVTNAAENSSWVELEGVASGAQTMWGVGIALLGVGVAAVGAGLVWALLPTGGSDHASSGTAARAQLRLSPGALFVEGEF